MCIVYRCKSGFVSTWVAFCLLLWLELIPVPLKTILRVAEVSLQSFSLILLNRQHHIVQCALYWKGHWPIGHFAGSAAIFVFTTIVFIICSISWKENKNNEPNRIKDGKTYRTYQSMLFYVWQTTPSGFQEKDANGCPVEQCVRNDCPPVPSLSANCLAFKSLNLTVNKCGCVHWDVGFCIGMFIHIPSCVTQMQIFLI